MALGSPNRSALELQVEMLPDEKPAGNLPAPSSAAPALRRRRPAFGLTVRLLRPQTGSHHLCQHPGTPRASPSPPTSHVGGAAAPGGPPGERALAHRAAQQRASRVQPPAGRPQPLTLPARSPGPARPRPSAGPRGSRRPAIGRWGGRAGAPAAAAPAAAGRAGAPAACCCGAAAVRGVLIAAAHDS